MFGSLDPDSESPHPSAGASLDSFDVVDPVSSSDYVARFDSDVAGLSPRRSSSTAMLRAARAARVVLLGEYHALDSACRTASWLIEQLAGSRRKLLLGMEMVHARDQRALDDHQRGVGGAALLQRRMRYHQEWGYSWAGPQRLLRTASRSNVPVFGLDMPPRGGVEDLTLRDEAAVERLVYRLAQIGPESLAIVVFGEAHLAPTHLPALLIEQLGDRATVLRVLHDVAHPAAPAGALYRSGDTFLVQHRPAAARERALARIYRSWAADTPECGELDLEAIFHGLLTHACGVLEIDPRRERVRLGVRLVDLFPEVVVPSSDSRRWGVLMNRSTIARRGGRLIEINRSVGTWNWLPAANAVMVTQPGIRAAAVEAGRFIAAHLRGELSETDVEAGAPGTRIVDYSIATAIAAWFDSGLTRLGSSALSDPWLPRHEASARIKRCELAVHRALMRGQQIDAALSRTPLDDHAPVERLLGYRYGIALARQRSSGNIPPSALIGLARRPLKTTAQAALVLESLLSQTRVRSKR
ncbi:MAG: ChaN family lipoprotein [Acidobacteriota bacterium]